MSYWALSHPNPIVSPQGPTAGVYSWRPEGFPSYIAMDWTIDAGQGVYGGSWDITVYSGSSGGLLGYGSFLSGDYISDDSSIKRSGTAYTDRSAVNATWWHDIFDSDANRWDITGELYSQSTSTSLHTWRHLGGSGDQVNAYDLSLTADCVPIQESVHYYLNGQMREPTVEWEVIFVDGVRKIRPTLALRKEIMRGDRLEARYACLPGAADQLVIF